MIRKYIVVSALACALPLLAQPSFAETGAKDTKPAASETAGTKPDAATQDIMKFSKDGNSAVRDIDSARISIFNGDTKLALDLIAKAKTSVAKAELEAPTFTVKTTESVEGKKLGGTSATDKAQLVPVDGQITLADDFVPTPEKNVHIKNANEHFKAGRSKEGIEELRLGEVEVMYKRVLMPLDSTSKHLDQAAKLMDDHKYYEANLVLKAIDDSLTTDSVMLTEAPKKP